jgi:hypothetical protein
MNNLDFYGPFLGNIDMVKQWRLYKEKGLYDQDIVDLCLHAVANCTGITVDVIQATDHGIRNVVVEPNKPGISSHRTIHLTNSHDHYNPVVSAQTKKNYECNPTLRQQLVIEHPKNEKKHDEKNNRYAALGDSSDDCFIVEPHNKKCPHLSGNVAAKSSTFDEQFDLKDEQSNAIDQQSDASDKQSNASDKRSTSSDDESHSSDEESHSSDEESHSSDELSNPLRVIGNRTYLNESIWEGVEHQNVEKLPLNIDGTLIFKIKVPGDSNSMEAAKDGRQWQRYVPSSRKGFTGTRRIAKCSSTHQCPSKH